MFETSLHNLKKISREELLIRLNRANHFKKYKGVMNFLIYHVDGFANLAYEHFIVQNSSSKIFLEDIKVKYPKLKPEYFPSLTSVKKARKEWIKEYEYHIRGQAVREVILKIDKVVEGRDKARPFLFNP